MALPGAPVLAALPLSDVPAAAAGLIVLTLATAGTPARMARRTLTVS